MAGEAGAGADFRQTGVDGLDAVGSKSACSELAVQGGVRFANRVAIGLGDFQRVREGFAPIEEGSVRGIRDVHGWARISDVDGGF